MGGFTAFGMGLFGAFLQITWSWLRPGLVPAALISPGFGRCCCKSPLGESRLASAGCSPQFGFPHTHYYIILY